MSEHAAEGNGMQGMAPSTGRGLGNRRKNATGRGTGDLATEQVSANVRKHGTGYRWTHEVNLWKDTLLPWAVLKIVLFAAVAPALLLLLVSVFEGNPVEGLRLFALVYGITAGILLGLFVITYPIFIMIKGGRYPVLFEMDDKGINHIALPGSTRRSDLLAWAGFFAGAVAGNPTVMGSNLLAASRKQMYTSFKKVRKVVVYERKYVLKLICTDMTRNLVYTQAEDFDLVRRLVLEQCKADVTIQVK